jgi:hypothetical protein
MDRIRGRHRTAPRPPQGTGGARGGGDPVRVSVSQGMVYKPPFTVGESVFFGCKERYPLPVPVLRRRLRAQRRTWTFRDAVIPENDTVIRP